MKQAKLPQRSCRVLSAAALVLASLYARSAESAPPPAAEHGHQPVDVSSRPIVSRIKLPLVHPRRMLVDPQGKLLIADWGSGKVLMVDANGSITTVADGLDEPAGLACGPDGNIYISTHAHGISEAGSIVRVSRAGEVSVYAAGLNGPTALAFDAGGRLYVANFHDDSISRVSNDGLLTLFAEGIPQPSAIAFDAAGTMFVASSAGRSSFSRKPERRRPHRGCRLHRAQRPLFRS